MLDLDFYQKYDTISLAKKLLGCKLIHQSPEGLTSGIIVETEAYLHNDPASHSFRGKTPRNEAMFHSAGIAYVYFIYGLYECFNIVSNEKGIGEAVLIRALEPIEGIELMQKRRKTTILKNLCSGPSKLVMAMGISKKNDFQSLVSENLYLEKSSKKDCKIVETTRIGISQGMDLKYRFYVEGSNYISKK